MINNFDIKYDSNKDGLNITYFVKDKKIHSILKMLKENYGKQYKRN